MEDPECVRCSACVQHVPDRRAQLWPSRRRAEHHPRHSACVAGADAGTGWRWEALTGKKVGTRPDTHDFTKTTSPARRGATGPGGLSRLRAWPRGSAGGRLPAAAESPHVGRCDRAPGRLPAADPVHRFRGDLPAAGAALDFPRASARCRFRRSTRRTRCARPSSRSSAGEIVCIFPEGELSRTRHAAAAQARLRTDRAPGECAGGAGLAGSALGLDLFV